MTCTKASIGLGNVDNTSDREKPVSRRVQLALDQKADSGHTHGGGSGGTGDMTKAVYDPNSDGVIDAAQLNLSGKADVSHTHTEYAALSHNHDTSYSPVSHTHSYEPANANIQAHVAAAHAPVNSQPNADITKAEIEAKLTGPLTSHSHSGMDTRTPYTLLATGATAMALASNKSVKVTPNANATYTTTVPPAGSDAYIMVLTSGTTSRTITFGSGFKPTTTLATGTVTARVFVLHWISDGVNLYESGRTTAMVA